MPLLKNNKLVLTLVVSVISHILLISLLYLTRPSTNTVLVQQTAQPISAQLYFYSPPIEPQPAPEQIAAEIQVPEQLPEPQPEPEQQETPAPVEPPQTPVTTVVSNAQLPSEHEDEDKQQEAQNEQLQHSPNSLYQLPLQDIAKDQLQRYQQGKLDNLAAQAASEYRQQLNSPTLFSKPQDSFMTEDEKLMQKVTKSVDCSSATNQTLAIVMGIMGGAIQCSKPPPFDSFIQKRLNKTAELPALNQQ